MGGKTNRLISDTAPATYLDDVLAKNGSFPFESQCIPTDKALLEVVAYKNFLEARRALISDRLNVFLGLQPIG